MVVARLEFCYGLRAVTVDGGAANGESVNQAKLFAMDGAFHHNGNRDGFPLGWLSLRCSGSLCLFVAVVLLLWMCQVVVIKHSAGCCCGCALF